MKSKLLFFFLGLLISFLITTSVRFFTYSEKHTHFHANFAVFVDGKRIEFKDNRFMEEISACSESGEVQPRQRAHLHEGNQDTIHIHQSGVTWAHFLLNLGLNVGDDFLVDDNKAVLKNTDTKKISFILNGKSVKSISNELIKSEDRLLINFGAETKEQINNEFNLVSTEAGEFNKKNDPASCSGHGDLKFVEKLKKALVN